MPALSPQYVTYFLICMAQGRMPALFFVVIISVDTENKALKVLCIGILPKERNFLTKFIISES